MVLKKLTQFLLGSQVVLHAPDPPDVPLRLVTFNIRYAATSLAPNEKPWPVRLPLLVDQLVRTAAEAPAGAAVLVDMQEVLDGQLRDIGTALGPEWAHIGVARDDGATKGEYNPILYRPDQLRLLHDETRWLSPTPDVPSYGWGAACRRVVTAGVFELVAGGGRFIAANTHLDHVSSEARERGVGVVLETVEALQSAWGPVAVSLTGDFNSEPGEDAYRAMVRSGYMEDLYGAAGPERRFGPYETYTGFSPEKDRQKRIDFIWLGPAQDKRWKVDRYEVLSNTQNWTFLSDHRAVVGDMRLV